MAIYIPFIFFLILPWVFGFYFNLSTIGTDDANRFINTSGDAYITSEGIQVTPNDRNMALGGKTGRATYVQPLHLWDKTSGNLADFTTHFSFVIDSSGNYSYADGLAFFLAPINSSVTRNEGGSGLGLASGNRTSNSSGNQFVAVEFDTFPNDWDPSMTHVGININSMKSVTTAPWWNNITQGKENDAWISYNSSLRSLGVVFTGFSSDNIQQGSLNYVVDLRDYLPEWVTFGFSAATGDWFEKNNIKSWDFSSSLQADLTPGSTPDPPIVNTEKKKKELHPNKSESWEKVHPNKSVLGDGPSKESSEKVQKLHRHTSVSPSPTPLSPSPTSSSLLSTPHSPFRRCLLRPVVDATIAEPLSMISS
ncbi:hypothetical protein RJ640_009865 [Escallonia rubra]|uniref:Legume lectin domain-containing protein n=2 Tax=Escallonia rubra TaxID=112253 RepID=A0AA88QBI1_9ASTE|nr:hypothetical protein RJ640_009865 [Escallonia rubra]